ncbi:RNA polymerase sigma factor [Tautonia sociabilis]|uniref:RNA polymerase sigma factor n=1 Tax=Tautonia sociabilis TaxID=2080755 RepID=A0A432MQF1_9BACT|nr:RNA polymerase sigma factor [Tautonia sociabilis]RUL89367.1 RNA polymerase sigma factor [Tautonia sociabilis]
MEPPSDFARSGASGGPSPGSDRLSPTQVADLFSEIGPELSRFLLGVLRNPDLAQDALQATFTKALERGHEARPESLRGWLFRVAYREAITLRRRDSRRHRLQRGLAWMIEATSEDDPNVDDPIVRREAVEAVRNALDTLPPAYLDVVRARIYEDKTFAQIARDQGLPLGTVLTRMRRALERLSRRLRDEELQ